MAAYYYRILEVNPDASQEEIRSTYRRLVKEWHPDLNSSEGAVERFHLIQKAWETLGDPEARAAYDAYAKRYTHRQGDVTVRPTGTGSQYRYSTRGRYPYNYRGPFQSGPTATPEEEARSYTKEWILVAFLFLIVMGIPMTSRTWSRWLLPVWHIETTAKVIWADEIITYEYFLADNERMTSDLVGKLRFVPVEFLSIEGMPLEPGDEFSLIYMPMAHHVNAIDFNRPTTQTLDRYYTLIWLRLQESALLDNLSEGAMKGVFLYSLCEAIFNTRGVSGLAQLYFAETPANINPVHNEITFRRLQQTPEFRQMVAEIRKVTMPLL